MGNADPNNTKAGKQIRGQASQLQPDVAFLFAHQNDAASTNRNDVAALHQLIPNFPRNNQQLVTRNNPDARVTKQNDVALLPRLVPQTSSWSLSWNDFSQRNSR
ncbi:calmodulin-binding receptor-like cytoplasmic kinase 3-like [Dorcoceras hygrometricum]|uniref:Calmodulin-binding receptor-like cytoplasmic kinase 3-like n=1 Tax=Dorcoceras hygrometricum TaxID=472368 RepID=A0A2Z7D968_9LAMI|nr:calmodulin-binding receptor-like cytoplasmic kinase 3-like [Dorcoceras hygrometricum]